MIVEKQGGKSKADYGDGLIKELSIQMTKDFGKGFIERNLRFMRQFYLIFSKRNALRTELSLKDFYNLFPKRETVSHELS